MLVSDPCNDEKRDPEVLWRPEKWAIKGKIKSRTAASPGAESPITLRCLPEHLCSALNNVSLYIRPFLDNSPNC